GVHLALFHGAELGGRPPREALPGPLPGRRIARRGVAPGRWRRLHPPPLERSPRGPWGPPPPPRTAPVARLLYPGSPEPLTFDEEGARGPVIVEISERGLVEYQPLPLNRWTAPQHDSRLEGSASSGEAVERARAAAREALAGRAPERT